MDQVNRARVQHFEAQLEVTRSESEIRAREANRLEVLVSKTEEKANQAEIIKHEKELVSKRLAETERQVALRDELLTKTEEALEIQSEKVTNFEQHMHEEKRKTRQAEQWYQGHHRQEGEDDPDRARLAKALDHGRLRDHQRTETHRRRQRSQGAGNAEIAHRRDRSRDPRFPRPARTPDVEHQVDRVGEPDHRQHHRHYHLRQRRRPLVKKRQGPDSPEHPDKRGQPDRRRHPQAAEQVDRQQRGQHIADDDELQAITIHRNLLCLPEASWINGEIIRVDGGERISGASR